MEANPSEFTRLFFQLFDILIIIIVPRLLATFYANATREGYALHCIKVRMSNWRYLDLGAERSQKTNIIARSQKFLALQWTFCDHLCCLNILIFELKFGR